MQSFLRVSALVAVVALLPATAGAAGDDEKRSRIDGPPVENPYSHGLRSPDGMPDEPGVHDNKPVIDTNDDGLVSDREAARYFSRYFRTIDADNDGKVSLREFPHVFHGPGPAMQAVSDEPDRWQKRKEARFAKVDVNDDGVVTQSEFTDYGERQYRKSDRNDDGEVTIWEFLARRHL